MSSANRHRKLPNAVHTLIMLLCLACFCEAAVADGSSNTTLTQAQVRTLLQEAQAMHDQAMAQGFGWRAVRLNLTAARVALQEGNLDAAAAKALEARQLSQLALQQARDEAMRWPKRFPSP